MLACPTGVAKRRPWTKTRRGRSSASRTSRRRSSVAPARRPVRRAALPLQLQLPRRRVAPRGAGRGGGPARPRGAGRHRPRRLLRRGPLRRGGARRRHAHGLRRRAEPAAHQAAERRSADPEGAHLLVLARDPTGLRAASPAPSARRSCGGEKGKPIYERAELCALHENHWLVLTGCRKGTVPARPRTRRPGGRGPRAGRPRRLLRARQRRGRVVGPRRPARQRRATTRWSTSPCGQGLDVVATNNVHYATPGTRPLATALAAVRARRSLDEIDPWLPAAATAHLRSGAEQARRFARYPGVVEAGGRARPRAARSTSQLVAPNLPPWPVPAGPHRDELPARAHRRGRGPPLRPARSASASPARTSRSTTSST